MFSILHLFVYLETKNDVFKNRKIINVNCDYDFSTTKEHNLLSKENNSNKESQEDKDDYDEDYENSRIRSRKNSTLLDRKSVV